MHRGRYKSGEVSLEAENRLLREQLDNYVQEARRSQLAHDRCHARELALLASDDLPQLLLNLTQGLRASFRLTCISLVLLDPDHALRHLLDRTGSGSADLDDVFFVDDLAAFNPLYGRLRKP